MALPREANTTRAESARILITDSDNRSALAATRSLGRAGYQVFTAGEAHPSLASASKYSSGFDIRGVYKHLARHLLTAHRFAPASRFSCQLGAEDG